MTLTDAINILKNERPHCGRKIRYTEGDICEAFDMAIKALEQEPILDKIRAEIDEEYDRVHPYDISCAEGLEMALNIIDKYIAEEDKA